MIPVIIAHRGASSLAKRENTLEAFQLAIDIQADYVEFDIRRSKDKRLLVFHDDNIEGRLLRDLNYSEICEISQKNGYTVPLLIDVLSLCQNKIKLDIEIKEEGYENQIVKMVTQMYHYDEFMMKSFIDNVPYRIKKLDPNIKTGLLLGLQVADTKRRLNEYFPERRLKGCNADFVSPNLALATREFIFRMHVLKKEVYVWTVNEPQNIAKFIKRNVDGIITDMPDAGIFVRKSYL